jgi:glycosyltransferase involved in cell wall biosynthesis
MLCGTPHRICAVPEKKFRSGETRVADGLTVLVPTGNEEANLRECLESARWADELFVVDSFSRDRTLEIAREFGARVVQHEYVNSAAQKNWAIPQAGNDWVFVLDADERFTPELAGGVRAVMALPEEGRAAAYRVYRRTFFMGREIRHCGWDTDSVIRLFDRRRARYPEQWVHANMTVEGRVEKLRGRLLHYTYRSLDQYFEKFDRYTTWSARDLAERGRRSSLLSMLGRPAARFLRMYVLRLGFLDGLAGAVLCGLAACSVFTKYAKLWERQRDRGDGKASDA